MNGGSVLAMSGKHCVAVAVDKRFGSGPALVQVVPRPPLLVASRTSVVAWTGMQSDVQSMQQDLSNQLTRTFERGLGFRSSTRSTDAPRISPKALASLTSHLLYRRKSAPYYVEPLVVGLEDVSSLDGDERQNDGSDGTTYFRPFLCSLDMIGARSQSHSFVCAGAATKSLYGTAEAMWRPDLEPNDLVRLCGQAFLAALERDCLSGYGALVYLITANGIMEYDLDSRND